MRLESSIQTEIIKKLKKRKHSFTYKHPPYPPGMPDIHHIEKGVSFYFEVKRSKDHKPTKLQKYIHKKLKKAGAKVYVVWSWEQVDQIISSF